MSHETKIKFRKEGIIDASCYPDLDPYDWAHWIKERLHGNDTLVPYDGKGILGDAFKHLANQLVEVRENIYSGIRLCLDDAYNYLVDWSNQGLDELLLLVNLISSGDISPFSNDIESVRRFLDVLEPRPDLMFKDKEEINQNDIYSRILQTLVGIRAELPYEFWKAELEHSPDKYAHFCFVGAENNAKEDAIKLLHDIDWSSEYAQNGMFNAFFVLERMGKTTLIEMIKKEKVKLPTEAQNIIDEAFNYHRKKN